MSACRDLMRFDAIGTSRVSDFDEADGNRWKSDLQDGCLKVHGLDGTLLHSDTLSPAQCTCPVTACRDCGSDLGNVTRVKCCVGVGAISRKI